MCEYLVTNVIFHFALDKGQWGLKYVYQELQFYNCVVLFLKKDAAVIFFIS